MQQIPSSCFPNHTGTMLHPLTFSPSMDRIVHSWDTLHVPWGWFHETKSWTHVSHMDGDEVHRGCIWMGIHWCFLREVRSNSRSARSRIPCVMIGPLEIRLRQCFVLEAEKNFGEDISKMLCIGHQPSTLAQYDLLSRFAVDLGSKRRPRSTSDQRSHSRSDKRQCPANIPSRLRKIWRHNCNVWGDKVQD